MFDAFLVGSRTATFTRGTLLVSIVLIGLASAVSLRAVSHQRSFRQTIEDRLSSAAKTRAEALEAAEETEEDEAETPEIPE